MSLLDVRYGQNGDVVVKLSWPDFETAVTYGLKRIVMNRQKKLPNRYGKKDTVFPDMQTDALGCAGEMVMHKFLRQEWTNPVGEVSRTAADVGSGFQVKTTEHATGSLLIHPKDVDDHLFLLVIPNGWDGEGQIFRLPGYLLGSEAKNSDFWRTDTGRPCYFVPQDRLQKIDLHLFGYEGGSNPCCGSTATTQGEEAIFA